MGIRLPDKYDGRKGLLTSNVAAVFSLVHKELYDICFREFGLD